MDGKWDRHKRGNEHSQCDPSHDRPDSAQRDMRVHDRRMAKPKKAGLYGDYIIVPGLLSALQLSPPRRKPGL